MRTEEEMREEETKLIERKEKTVSKMVKGRNKK